MIADILKTITQSSVKEDRLICQLLAENDKITSQLQQIDDTINLVNIADFQNVIQQYGGKSYNARTSSQPLHQKIEIIQQFYALCAKQEEENKKHQLLIDEANQINELSLKYDLIGTISLKDSQPDEATISFIKQQIKDLGDQLMSWQNQQNENKFNAEDGEIVPQYIHIIKFISQFRNVAVQIYASLVASCYKATNTDFSIYKEHFDTVWSQQQAFTNAFLESLQNYLQKFLIYDINDRQYIALIYEIEQNDRKLRMYQKSRIVFDSSEIGLHYEQMVSSLTHLKHFFTKLEEITIRQKLGYIQQLKKKTMQKIKQYFQYLIPYLKMQMRRHINSFFDTKSEAIQLSIYQLLVNLKISGQDADIMMSTIHQMIKRVEQNFEEFKIIMKFIEMAKQDRKNNSMLLFVSDQLIQGFEEVENINQDVIRAIRELLVVRQEMRMKIHSVEI